MPIRIEARPRYVHVQWSGLVIPADLDTLFKDLPHVARANGVPPLVLHTAAPDATMLLGAWHAAEYSERRARTSIPGAVKVAFAGGGPVCMALARGFRSFNANPNLSMEVFPGEVEAVAWLLATNEAPAA